MRDQKRNCEATKIRAAGVVLVKFHYNFLTNTTPALRASPPLLRRGHYFSRTAIHSHLDRPRLHGKHAKASSNCQVTTSLTGRFALNFW